MFYILYSNITKYISYRSHESLPDIFLVVSSSNEKKFRETEFNGAYICSTWPKPVIMAHFNKDERKSRKSKLKIVIVSLITKHIN